jgi:TolA-binding protein
MRTELEPSRPRARTRANLAGLVLVVAVATLAALGPGESAANRDRGAEALKKVEVLQRANQELTSRLTATEEELVSMRVRLDAVEVSQPKQKTSREPTTRPQHGPAAKPVLEDAVEFRSRVLKALAPELASIDKSLEAAVTKSDFAKHTHTHTQPNHGWATQSVISSCKNCLLPYVPPEKNGKTLGPAKTSVPN